MKKLSIEEKAKAYDKAIKVAEKYHNGTLKDVMETIFPELKESEDEKIMKWIRKELEDKYVTDNIVNNVMADKVFAWLEKQEQHKKFRDGIQVGDKVTRNRDGMLVNLSQLNRVAKKDEKQGVQKPILDFNANDWYVSKVDNKIHNVKHEIEKQGDQKPTDKFKPKFKIGDWIITNKKHIWYIDETPETTSYMYRLINQYGKVEVAEFEIVDKKARLWTIQDAKDGDVLYCKSSGIEYIVMNKGVNEYGNIDSYFRYNSFNGFGIYIPAVLSTKYDNITPATKEQRDLLFQKMKEAGYEWNANKKELKKIEQKPAWSEEEFAHIVGCLVQDIVANEHMPEEEKQPTKFFVEKYYKKLREE